MEEPTAISEKIGKELKERYDEYCNSLETQDVVPLGSEKMPSRNNFFICEEHIENKQWDAQIHGQCCNCIKYTAVGKISGGLLFTGKDVLSRLLTMKSMNTGKQINNELNCAIECYCHWVHCNVYPISYNGIVKRIKEMHKSYVDLKRYDQKKKTPNYWMKYKTFADSQNKFLTSKIRMPT